MPHAGAPQVSARSRGSQGALSAQRSDAADCKACPRWKGATQTVFGEGTADSKLMLVGEQPGDYEDRAGHPFVGPAGRILDQAMEAAGIPRASAYVTNAVKHFKWVPRGKRRLHKTPAQREVAACLQWLEQEIGVIAPALIVCLGATATAALLGPSSRVGALRGRIIRREEQPSVLVTVHPSFILRMTGADREDALARFIADLRVAKRFVASRR
jgi:DNA polymerase